MRDRTSSGLGDCFVFAGGDAQSGHSFTRPLQNRAWKPDIIVANQMFATPETCFYD
jgi:hypothetical protein